MNTRSVHSAGEVDLTAGRVRWDRDGRVDIVTPDGVRATAGDGVATAIVRALATGAAGTDSLPRLRVRADSTVTLPSGVERALATDVDMTNWNVVVDDHLIVKVTGRLGEGDRAARLTRAVARHEPDLVPTLHGTLEVVFDSGSAVIASVTELVPSAVDGWTWAVDDVLGHLRGAAVPSWPRAVGGILARMHRALHRESGPSPSSSSSEGAGELGRGGGLEELVASGTDASRRLLARRATIDERIRSLPVITAPRFALHGDCHVGQVLRDADGCYTIIDFDGDPQGGNCDDADAAVDVAHMIVSIDMVAAVVAKRLGQDDPRILPWSTAAQRELIAAYRAESERRDLPVLLDESRLPALVATQLLKELTYARDFLPRWEYAADWAITHRFNATPDLEDPPWIPPAFSTT